MEMLLKMTFETEALPKEYLKVMYKEKTGHYPEEEEYNPSKTIKENLENCRKEWEETKKNIDDYINQNIKTNYKEN